jgi:hypothetical protein
MRICWLHLPAPLGWRIEMQVHKQSPLRSARSLIPANHLRLVGYPARLPVQANADKV